MRLFQRDRERRDATTAAMDYRRRITTSGQIVNDETSMTLGAVWGCVDLISELVSTLPIDEYRKVNGVRQEVTPRSPLLDDPAGDGTGWEVWARQVMTSALLRGNAYGLINQLGGDGWPVQIESLAPDRVTWRRELNFGPVESYLDNHRIERWPNGPLWHMPVYVLPGSPIGMSPISAAANTIGIGLAAQRFGAGWFNSGGIPLGTLETDQVLDSTQASDLRRRVNETLADGSQWLVLGAGLKFNSVQIDPQEAQYLETMKANADDVAKFFFRRPPGEGGQVTYANVEARSLDLLTYTLNGWLVRIEKSVTRLRPRPRYVKINADALVRVDLLTRMRVHSLGIRSGINNPDEVRELEDLPPIPDGKGKEFLWPPFSSRLVDGSGSGDPRDGSGDGIDQGGSGD